ncbi:MAG: inositol monophosphatase family protein [Bacteriovorax sp.]|nr:inositol monophosphatase family protein [Bacteriovorax sp.]
MKKVQKELILQLTKKLSLFFGPKALSSIEIKQKNDNSLVTEIDFFVSEFLKQKLSEHEEYAEYSFFSEEDFKAYTFPCAILDPIDGTRELVRGRPECAVSLALMKTPDIDDPSNFAWLYNPFSGFNIDTNIPFIQTTDKSIHKVFTFVSRSEFHNGRYDKYLNNPQIDITPRGSIAFKLGLLASGACDFIVSLESKNVWDIAAGTILCSQRGIHFYENGKRITKLDRQTYNGALIWVPEYLSKIVLDTFKSEFKSEIN